MTATDELRRMLDELNIKHFDYHKGGWTQTQWEAPDGNRHFTYETYDNPARTAKLVISWFPTPEQAIEATLGRGTCKNIHEPPKDTTFWPAPHFKCSECGATHVSMGYVHFCPSCGRKVVDA